MDLETYKKVYGKECAARKLYLLVATMEQIGNCRVAYMEAERNRNYEEAEYYDRERKAQDERAMWLYGELFSTLEHDGGVEG